MSRVFFSVGKQREFLEKVKDETSLGWEEIAELCGICRRSLTDWRREKLHTSLKAVRELEEASGIEALHIKKIKRDHWQIATKEMAIRGALARYKKYGNPGTSEGRKKGGFKRLKVSYPQKSSKVAEFIGIMLGDGGITKKQISITLHSEDDREYFQFVFDLTKELFKVEPGVFKRKESRAIRLQVSRMDLVDFLVYFGLKKGNKIKQGVDIPKWIKGRRRFEIACLRGLMDTDGGVFTHRYRVNGKLYVYKKMCFGSHSKPLLKSVSKILSGLGFTPKIKKEDIYLYNEKEVKRYFKEIKTHNPKHLRRFLS